MSPLWCILIDLLLLWFFLGDWLLARVLPASLRRRRLLRQDGKSLRLRLRRNRDLLTPEQLAQGEALLAKTEKLRKEGTQEEQEALLDTFRKGIPLPPTPQDSAIGANFETLLVSVAVAFALRCLLLQPFKIPTGSMQPTLYGIHPVALDAGEIPRSRLASLFDYVNYSRRYFQWEAPADGALDFSSIHALPSRPLFPQSSMTYRAEDGRAFSLVAPASVTDTQRLVPSLQNPQPPWRGFLPNPFAFSQGQTIFRGAMESGDHLFVNRLSLCLRPPARGDIMVFSTEDLSYQGRSLSGFFYVKRLVGLPGDTLKIQDRVLWVRPQGADQFLPLDGTYSRPFARIQSRQGGYAGHAALSAAAYLSREGEEYTVPSGHYFLMGDNTENSLDCRFFGPVARKRLVGRPCLVWWPFSPRFGFRFDAL
ncbi:MAG: signal peptidase I [Oligosphaeraceae bacterium]